MDDYTHYVDSHVYERLCACLDWMVEEGEIDPEDRDRFMRELDWINPPEINNSRFIQLVSLLQQKRGEEQANKRTTDVNPSA